MKSRIGLHQRQSLETTNAKGIKRLTPGRRTAALPLHYMNVNIDQWFEAGAKKLYKALSTLRGRALFVNPVLKFLIHICHNLTYIHPIILIESD